MRINKDLLAIIGFMVEITLIACAMFYAWHGNYSQATFNISLVIMLRVMQSPNS